MRWWINGLAVPAMLAMGSLVSVSTAAEEERTPPQFHFEGDYRAPVGPPAPRGASDRSVSDQQRAAKAYEESRGNEAGRKKLRGPLTLEMQPLDWHGVVGEVARLSGANVNYYNRHRLYLDQRLPSGTLVEVLEFAPDSLTSRQFDNGIEWEDCLALAIWTTPSERMDFDSSQVQGRFLDAYITVPLSANRGCVRRITPATSFSCPMTLPGSAEPGYRSTQILERVPL